MMNWKRLISLMLVLCVCIMPVFALASDAEDEWEEEWEYEDGYLPLMPEIELKSNPSTGYHWTYTCDEPDVLEVVEHGFVSDEEGLLGAPGVECFRLDGCEMGMAVVTFRYARGEDAEPLYTVTYQVQVTEKLDVCIFQTSVEMN